MSEDIQEVSTENNTVSTEPSESEVKAKRLGWVPQEDFKGDPDKWRDAEIGRASCRERVYVLV